MTAATAQASHIDEVRTQFARQAQAYADTAQARDLRAMWRLVRLLRPASTARALDVACGPGRLTRALASSCAEAVGVDVTDAMLQIARIEAEASSIGNVKFVPGDAAALDFPDGDFDIVCCRGAFHHFESPADALREMVRVTTPGGRLLIADMVAATSPREAAEQNTIERLCDPTHAGALSRGDFESLFAAANLGIERCVETELSHDIDTWLAHGGPDERAATAARRLLERRAGSGSDGLLVSERAGQLLLTHKTVVYVLRRPLS